MLRTSVCLVALLCPAALARAVDLNRLVPGPATIVEEFGGGDTSLVKNENGDKSKAEQLVKFENGDSSKAKELVKFETGDKSKEKELVKFETGDKAKEKELVKTVTSNKAKERALVKEIMPLEIAITVTPSRSRLYHAKYPIERFSISNPNLIEVIQYSPLEFELLGRNPGECTLTIWFSDDTGIAGGVGAERVLRLGVRVGRDDGR